MTPMEFIQQTGLTYEQVAAIVGVTPVSVYRWINNRRSPGQTVYNCLYYYHQLFYCPNHD